MATSVKVWALAHMGVSLHMAIGQDLFLSMRQNVSASSASSASLHQRNVSESLHHNLSATTRYPDWMCHDGSGGEHHGVSRHNSFTSCRDACEHDDECHFFDYTTESYHDSCRFFHSFYGISYDGGRDHRRICSQILLPNCEYKTHGYPEFHDKAALEANSEWKHYFEQNYGGVPEHNYPICVGSFTQLLRRALPSINGKTMRGEGYCNAGSAKDGDLLNVMSKCCDPPGNRAAYILNSRNKGFVVPGYTWVEVSHAGIEEPGSPWYYVAFGSAIWFNTGKTWHFNDHYQASRELLGESPCHDRGHTSQPPTECEGDFAGWTREGKKRGLTTIQFNYHYDCTCGETGLSSWDGHNRHCSTEFVDLTGNDARNPCRGHYRAGWGAAHSCDCQPNKPFSNCKGYGMQ